MQCLWRRWQPCILLANPTSARKDFNPQPKLVLIYRPRKGERLSWPEQMWVNNLPKVNTRQPSNTTGIRTWATRSWNRCANHSATTPMNMDSISPIYSITHVINHLVIIQEDYENYIVKMMYNNNYDMKLLRYLHGDSEYLTLRRAACGLTHTIPL